MVAGRQAYLPIYTRVRELAGLQLTNTKESAPRATGSLHSSMGKPS